MTTFGQALNLQVVTPAAAILTTQEAKDWARITDSSEDTIIDRMIADCTDRLQAALWSQFVTQTYDWSFDNWNAALEWDDAIARNVLRVPYPPLQSITSIKYYDVNNAQQTWTASEYMVDAVRKPGRITTAAGFSWPSLYDRPNAVTVRFVAGYGTGAQTPAAIRNAVLALFETQFRDRGHEIDVSGAIRRIAAVHGLRYYK